MYPSVLRLISLLDIQTEGVFNKHIHHKSYNYDDLSYYLGYTVTVIEVVYFLFLQIKNLECTQETYNSNNSNLRYAFL